MKTYTVTATFTVHDGTDAHLKTTRAIRDELRSWLESLNATVRTIDVAARVPKEDK